MADAPNYALCPVISEIEFATEDSRDRTEIRCIAAFGRNIYLGCSTGDLMTYTLEESVDGTVKYMLTSKKALKSRSPIASIQLVPSFSRAIVLSDDTLSFFSLPHLDPIPSEIMRSMRNVLHFAINETPGPQESVGIAVVKRNSISFWEMGSKLGFRADIPIEGVMHVRRSGPSLCIADLENYVMVDLTNFSKVDIHPISLSETWKILPKIEVFRPNEYLIVTCTGTSEDYTQVYSLGLIVNGRGDPAANPMEWNTMPECVCAEGDQVLSLHLDITMADVGKLGVKGPTSVVEVRKSGESTIIQTLPLLSTTGGDVRLMVLARDGFVAPANSRQEKLLLVPVALSSQKEQDTTDSRQSVEESKLGEPAGSGLTPPPTPKKPVSPPSRGQERGNRGRHSESEPLKVAASTSPRFPTSRVLLATRNSVYALLPLTLLSQIEQMLEAGKVKDAATFLAQSQAKHAKDDDLVADFRYLNLRIGIAYLFQTAFEDAGDALFRGELDPRWLMGLWEEWAAIVKHSASSKSPLMVEVYSGLQPTLEKLKGTTVEQIVSRSLVANYSPHLKPSTTQSTAGQELKTTLIWSARQMLSKYLRKFRTRRQYVGEMGGMYTDEAVNRAVDTVSIMLYVQTSDPDELQELRSLLDESPFISLEDLRDPLVDNGHIASLARMYEKKNDQSALIELYIKVADGIWKDESISEPIFKVRKLLQNSKDRNLVQRHALWLLKRDRSSGLKLLISSESRTARSPEEDIKLLNQIREVDTKAAIKFLEHLVLQKRTLDPSLHTQLATSYLDSTLQNLEDPKIADSQRAALDGYLSSASRTSRPFLFHLAFETPDSEHKRVRLKLVLMLQGSGFYDLEGLRRKLRIQEANLQKLLCLETAILDAKATDHKAALSILVNDLEDFISAEAYCSLGGRVITPKTALAIGDRLHLADWAALVLALDAPGGGIANGNMGRARRQGSNVSPGVNGVRNGISFDSASPSEPRKAVELTKMLLEVYMKAGESRATEASRLLNAQAVNLDAADIIPQMPASWSLDLVSSFLSRSFRRSLHEVYEGQILKQLSAGQNLQTSELAFEVFAAAGAMIEESNGNENEGYNEPDSEEESANEDGSNELKELTSRAEEKLVEKRRLDHNDTRPQDIQPIKPDQ